eukprot:GSChrysophyteH1.ASY1.ANO1.604.1 assembled CDS
MLVTYFLQGEPGETPDQPNAFRFQGSAPVRFSHFLQSFPLLLSDPHAKLHFRFRAVDKACGYVWVDVTKHDEEVPLFKGNIYAKVLRSDSFYSSHRYINLKRKSQLDAGAEGASVISKMREEQNHASTVREGANQHQSQQKTFQSPQRSIAADAGGSAPNLIDDEIHVSNISHIPNPGSVATAAVEPSNLAPTKNTSWDSSTSNKDCIEEPKAVAAPAPTPAPAPAPLDRAELAAKRQSQIEENVQRALEEKQERDTMLRKENDEMDAARARHDSNLTDWAFDASKKKRNVRTLLTTMQKVLWEGNKWKEIGLGDVLQPKQVKLKYRKAMLVVHPDRLAGESAEIRFIAKRIFEAINEQYQEFLKAESPDN